MVPIEIATSSSPQYNMSPRPPVIYYVRYYSQRYGKKVLGVLVLTAMVYFALWFMHGGVSICRVANSLSMQVDEDVSTKAPRTTLKRHRYSDHTNPNTLDSTELLSPAARRRHFYHPVCLQTWLEASTPSQFFQGQNQSRDFIASYIQQKYQILDFDVIRPLEKKGYLDDAISQFPSNSEQADKQQDKANKPLHYVPMECDKDQFQTNSITFSAPSVQDEYHHFLNFIASYYRHYSLLLWQSNIYHTVQESCINGFAVDESVAGFWQTAMDVKSPIRHIIQLVNRYSGYQTITTNVCNSVIAGSGYQKSIFSIMLDASEQFFLHPADALLMSTTIARVSPCTWAKQGHALVSKGANVTVIQVPSTLADGSPVPLHSLSHVGNYLGFTDYIKHHFQKQSPYLIQQVTSATLTASMPLKQVATTYLSTDIVLTLDSNMANFLSFMKPCSVLVFLRIPRLTDEHGMFVESEEKPIKGKEQAVIEANEEVLRKKLAASSDILYRSLDLSLAHAMLDQDFLSRHSNCQPFFTQAASDESREVSMNHVCLHAIMGWDLQKDAVKALLHDVIKERNTCLKSHVYYA